MRADPRRVRFVVSVAVLLLLSLACAANTQQSRMARFVEPDRWQEMRYENLGLLVHLPADPEIHARQTTADDGGPMLVTTGVVMSDELALGFTVFTDPLGFIGHPMTGDRALARVAERSQPNARSEEDSEIRDEHEIYHHGFAGREATLVNAQNGILMHIRYFVGRERAYAVFAAMAIEDDARLRWYADRYFEAVRFAQSDALSPEGQGRLDYASWSYAFPPEAAFAAEMPGRAGRSEVSLVLEGSSYPTRSYSVTDGPHTFSVIETRFGDQPNERVLAAVRDRLVSTGMTVRAERDIQLQGYSGREVDFTAHGASIRSRFYLTGSRLYEVRVSVPGAEEVSTRAQADRFLQSFRIL